MSFRLDVAGPCILEWMCLEKVKATAPASVAAIAEKFKDMKKGGILSWPPNCQRVPRPQHDRGAKDKGGGQPASPAKGQPKANQRDTAQKKGTESGRPNDKHKKYRPFTVGEIDSFTGKCAELGYDFCCPRFVGHEVFPNAVHPCKNDGTCQFGSHPDKLSPDEQNKFGACFPHWKRMERTSKKRVSFTETDQSTDGADDNSEAVRVGGRKRPKTKKKTRGAPRPAKP